jgi:peroxiredoxin (alkyl hydroperoxide reductase subunit C)
MVTVGQPAPRFEGQAYVAGQVKKVSLDDYRDRWLLLFFYPLDFTRV